MVEIKAKDMTAHNPNWQPKRLVPAEATSVHGETPSQRRSPAKWQLLRAQKEQVTPIYTAWQKRFRHEKDGREGDFFTFECPDWVQAVAFTAEGELILVEQFRFGTESFGWELPGGVMDAEDEGDSLVAARRELLEETGYAAASARSLGQAYPNPALQGNRVHYVLLEGCTLVAQPSPDANEELHCRLVDWETAQTLLDSGAISHALSIAGLYACERDRRSREAKR